MNRIILIGNGFDLAHGLKTSYKDFMDDYWERKQIAFEEFVNNDLRTSKFYIDAEISITNIIHQCAGAADHKEKAETKNGYDKFTYLLQESWHRGTLLFKNKLLLLLSQHYSETNWSGIEFEYFTALKRCDSNNITKLNQEFNAIKEELKNYLTGINHNLLQQQNIYNKDIAAKIYFDAIVINSILFLSFNYTDTHKIYLDKNDFKDFTEVQSIQIHGSLTGKNNSIIFGYGDEIDDNFKQIESLNDNRFFENIKTIKYLDTNNYDRLLKFINSEDYEIFIMGHSCGLSDRTLLNTMFEHSNCKSIKVFYHKDGNKDYFADVTTNIYRNFTDKKMAREKVKNKNLCEPLSQWTNE